MFDGRLGDALVGAAKTAMILLVITVPLAIWKLVEIIVWVCCHLEVGWK